MPSVTTVLGVVDKSYALIPWAINQTIGVIRPAISPGVEHAESYLEEVYAQAKKESGRVKREAADIGTRAHEFLERYPIVLPPAEDGPVRNCVLAGLEWLNSREISWLHREKPIYSRRHRYSGRLDGIATVDGVVSLVDWKSSKGVYPEFRLQTAAYVHAYEEEFLDQRIEQRILIRLGKDDGAFEPHVYGRDSLRQDFQGFLGALTLYKRLQSIEKEKRNEEKLSRVVHDSEHT